MIQTKKGLWGYAVPWCYNNDENNKGVRNPEAVEAQRLNILNHLVTGEEFN